MIDGVIKSKGVRSTLIELGLIEETSVIQLKVDSAAAKSFISRRGSGRMRHVEFRDLWIQKEVGEGKVCVSKVAGTRNPADVGTKFLGIEEIREKLGIVGLRMQWQELEVDGSVI